ncbi:MAG: cell division protein FtsH, partial [Alphaproteobacteria bacterium]|nr:cell division protein FtsH [Alphaproteobacteria bacterium]
EGYNKAEQIIRDKIDELHIIAKGLLEYETLTGDEIVDLLKGKKPDRLDPKDDDQDKGEELETLTSVPKTGSKKPPPHPSPQGT